MLTSLNLPDQVNHLISYQIRAQGHSQVELQADDQVWAPVYWQVDDQVSDQVWAQVEDSLGAY